MSEPEHISSIVERVINNFKQRKLNEGQKKSHSFAEAIFNIAIGFFISMAANMIVLPWFGFKVSLSSAFNIGVIFTIISIVRSYILRRLFNRIMLWQAK